MNRKIRLILKRTNMYYKLYIVDIKDKQHIPITHFLIKKNTTKFDELLNSVCKLLTVDEIKTSQLKIDFAVKKSMNAKLFVEKYQYIKINA